ncbi:NAD(P)-binding domain-containing protein [Kitasatospora sp. NPDC093558]|uniref:NADPH-dependent F420 reductase n=1 Tax=Kitasatospora sp. NPDC093558 TaxID=3155201 RepID=UPI00343D14C4
MSKILVIGKGNVGGALEGRFAAAGHEVTAVNSAVAPAKVAQDAAAADVVVLAVPFAAVAGLDAAIKSALSGKVVIDATNPLAPDFVSLTVGHTTSGGEEVAKALPGAKVAKAFNSVFANHLATGAVNGAKLFLPVAGDDEDAKKTALELATELGFDAVDAGPLANARYIEPAIELLIQLAFVQGQGTGIGLTLARG